jgi:hypothetical protein
MVAEYLDYSSSKAPAGIGDGLFSGTTCVTVNLYDAVPVMRRKHF